MLAISYTRYEILRNTLNPKSKCKLLVPTCSKNIRKGAYESYTEKFNMFSKLDLVLCHAST